MHDLSIILPTCNRADLLERSLAAIAFGVNCNYELIVVDGASTDRTESVLAEAGRHVGDRLQVIREPQREGFVRAVNKGFVAATGRNLIWINDDARPLPGALDSAVIQLDAAPGNVGMLALFHRWKSTKNVAYEIIHRGHTYRLLHVRGTLYANFGLARRETFAALGYFDPRFHYYGADPDFSLKVWNSGLIIVPAYGCIIDHDEHEDDRRSDDATHAERDNATLFSKWILPSKNHTRNDFDPGNPCTLAGPRNPDLAVA